jgi:hypothetical protein
MPDASNTSTAPTTFFWLSVRFLSVMAALTTVVVAVTGIILPDYLCGQIKLNGFNERFSAVRARLVNAFYGSKTPGDELLHARRGR